MAKEAVKPARIIEAAAEVAATVYAEEKIEMGTTKTSSATVDKETFFEDSKTSSAGIPKVRVEASLKLLLMMLLAVVSLIFLGRAVIEASLAGIVLMSVVVLSAAAGLKYLFDDWRLASKD